MKQAIFFAGVAAMILASCAKERAEQDSTQTEQAFRGTVVTIQAALGSQETAEQNPQKQNAATKTTQTDGNFSWTDGEQISVGTSDGEYVSFNLVSAANGTFTHTFPGDVPELQMAISPVQSGSYDSPTNFTVSLPTVYNDYVSGTTNALMIGTPDTGPSTEKRFLFHHAAALVKVTYENVPAGTKGLVLTTDKNIASSEPIGLSSTNAVITTENTKLNSKSVRLNLASAVNAANQTLVFYVPVPVGSYTGLKIYLIDSSGNRIDRSEKTSTKSFTLARKEIFATPGITVDITIDPVTVGTDNTGGLGANKSQKFKINQGKRLNLIFENFSAATSQPYYNWVVYNDKNNLYVRADKYAKDNTIDWGQTSVGNFPASTTYNAADLNETKVIMTIDYYESGAYILNAVAKKNDTTYDLQFQYTYSTKPEEINIQLYTDNSHFVMKDAWLEDAPVIKEVVGIEATADMIVYGESTYVCLSKEALKVKKVYSDGTKESVGYGEFSVSYTANTDYSAVMGNENLKHLGLASSNKVLAKVSYGGYNAFCDISITKRDQIQTTRVGNESNTSPWRTDSESTWTVSPGTSVTLGMNLYSAQTLIYQSPSVLLMKNDNTEFGFVRIDDNGYNYDPYSIVTSRSATTYSSFIYNWILNNSQVFITIANHEDGIASVTYYHKSNSNNYSISHYNMNVGQEDLKFKISIEGASVVML